MKTEGPRHALARSDALQLHNERVDRAVDALEKARNDLEAAQSKLKAVVLARDAFKLGQMMEDVCQD